MFNQRFDKIYKIKYNIAPMYDTLEKFLENVVKEYSMSTTLATHLYQLDDCLKYVQKYLQKNDSITDNELKTFMTNMDVPNDIISYIFNDTQYVNNNNKIDDCFVVTITNNNVNKNNIYCNCNNCKENLPCSINIDGHKLKNTLYTKSSTKNTYIVHNNQIYVSKYKSNEYVNKIFEKEEINLVIMTDHDKQYYDIIPGNGNNKQHKYWDLDYDKIFIDDQYFIVNCYNCDTIYKKSNKMAEYTKSDKILKYIKMPLIDGIITDTPIGHIVVKKKKFIKDFIINY